MKKFNIQIPDHSILPEIEHKINTKTKPQGALGSLEKVASQIARIQQTLHPSIENPSIIVFAADHGIAKKGEVNPFPQEVTAQMVYNFLNKGAAINVFCKVNQIDLEIVDAGVNHSFKELSSLINAKIAFGTYNYQKQPAMSKDDCIKAIEKGVSIIEQKHKAGTNTIGFGEMGIGNTSSAALLMAYCTQEPIENCVGAGTGLENEAIQKKIEILTEVYQKYQPENAIEALTIFGGFEIAMIVGAILEAAALQMVIMIDGFIVTSALLIAVAIEPNVIHYCLFAHCSDEKGHQKMLSYLKVEPLLSLGLRLGEGTGAALAFPLVKAATAFFNEMASFENAGVSNASKI